ncbi:MAG: RDD family protein [Clostridium sp.]|uniref:RDD family protein n=1 Tax=Clostridium sp. TaxID=1506 RepID=UPI002908CE28|nr:RDD family protein [Clostridium sp.]MDU5108800.1 RDD family protein [Clostridium sp.]
MENNNEEVIKEVAIDTKETVEEILEEDVISSSEEILMGDSSLVEGDTEENDSKIMKFIKRALASAIDQIIVIAISLLLLVVFDFALRILGFYVAERQPIFFIIYVLVNIVYEAICSSTKLKKTIGKKTILK